MGISNNALYQFDGATVHTQLVKQSESKVFNCLALDHHNNFLIGTSTGEVFFYNPYSHKTVDTLSFGEKFPVTHITCDIDRNESLYVSYGQGLRWVTDHMDTLLTTDNLLISNEVYAVLLDHGDAYLATDQGIQIIQNLKGRLISQTIRESDGLGDIIIVSIAKHKQTLWASNFDSQIYKIDLDSRNITTYDLPIRSRIHGMKVLKDNAVFVYTNAGIFGIDGGTWIQQYRNPAMQMSWISSKMKKITSGPATKTMYSHEPTLPLI